MPCPARHRLSLTLHPRGCQASSVLEIPARRAAALAACITLVVLLLGSCASGHSGEWGEEPPVSRSLGELEARLRTALSDLPVTLTDISEDPSNPVWLARYDPPGATARVLVCAGIHGNEPAGVEFALRLPALLTGGALADAVAVDLLPLINAWGWARDVRYNSQGRDINRDFASFATAEARGLRSLFAEGRYDLVVDHHEDRSAKGFYIYEYAPRSRTPARAVLGEVQELGFPLEQDVTMVILRTRNGLIHAPLWGLWYMRLSRQLSMTNYLRLVGNRAVYTVETPTSLSLEERVLLHRTAFSVLLDEVGGERRR